MSNFNTDAVKQLLQMNNWNNTVYVSNFTTSVEKQVTAGKTYYCVLEHYSTQNQEMHLLIKVDEDDVEWRTIDDHSEISYSWNVIMAAEKPSFITKKE